MKTFIIIFLCITFLLIVFISIFFPNQSCVSDLTRRALIARIDNLDQRTDRLERNYPFFNTSIKREKQMFNNVIDEDFALWAFGDTWYGFLVLDNDSRDLLNAWNDLHGDVYRVEETDIISESIEEMREIYEQEQQYQESMDKKMHKVTTSMKVAEKDIKKGKPELAVKTLKGAEKKNEKLVKIDKNVRDPIIDKTKKLCKEVSKTKGK